MAAIDLDKVQWQQLKGVLTDVLNLPSAERVEILNRRLAKDPTLRERAIEMLRYYDRATKPFGATETQSETRGDLSARTPQSQLAAGEVVGNYRIVRKLGEGGMGVVYLAQDERLGRHVALKLLFPSVRGKLMDSKGHLLAEARSAAILNHPGIVTFHDVFEHQGELVAVMEYVEGRPLGELIAGEPLPLGFALRLVGQLADALAYAHGRGIIHCDLKPANIHVLANGATKILDFGIARAVSRPDEDSVSPDGPFFGTPGYLSPERMLGREATASSDVYALGVVMYQLLTGVQPFRTDDDAQLFLDTLTATPLAPSTLVLSIPTEVDSIVLRCLSKNARERLQPHELLRMLNGVLRDLDTMPVPTIGKSTVTVLDRPSDSQNAAAGAGSANARTNMVAVPGDVWQQPAIRALVLIIGFAVSVSILGLISSTSYNRPLGLDGRFATETPWLWPIWGVRSLLAVAGLMVILSIFCILVFRIGQMAIGTAAVRRRAPWLTSLPRLFDGWSNGSAAVWLLIAQLAALAGLAWWFGDVLRGLDSFLNQRNDALAVFRPQNRPSFENLIWVLAGQFLVFGYAWRAVARRSRQLSNDEARVFVFAGVGVLAFSLIVFQCVPYRIVYQSQAERVTYQSERCYLIGRDADDALLFCPGRTRPFTVVVKQSDPELRPGGSFENIFSGYDR